MVVVQLVVADLDQFGVPLEEVADCGQAEVLVEEPLVEVEPAVAQAQQVAQVEEPLQVEVAAQLEVNNCMEFDESLVPPE